ncbi:hypothetical protein RB195_008886 [Necator americanus]|uniref:Leucine Rich repeat-containing domain protein n=1 Tax=Necator americanus TaxID=51031 RepID=A0ABR1CQT6_NECAM
MGLMDTNVTELRIYDIDETMSLIDLAKYLPYLKSLEINTRRRHFIDVFNTFRHLKLLENLRIVNVDVEFSRTIPPWIHSIKQIHIENSTLRELPIWLAMSNKLNTLTVKTKLSGNAMKDLGKHVFLSKDIYDIDLSRNMKLEPGHFVGLTSLKSLTLSYSPLRFIHPFAFLPLKSLKSLDLEATNITTIPSAIIQNCGLTLLNVAHNMLHGQSSLQPEVVAMLSGLSQLKMDGNPLSEFPPSLFLLSTDNFRLIRQIFQTMTSLPLWTEEPCTPYYWAMHLRNRSSTFRHLVLAWSEERMEREGLSYCREQYEWMIEDLEIYRDFEKSSGCSANRRFRSAALATNSLAPCGTNSSNITLRRKQIKSSVVAGNQQGLSNLLLASLIANARKEASGDPRTSSQDLSMRYTTDSRP